MLLWLRRRKWRRRQVELLQRLRNELPSASDSSHLLGKAIKRIKGGK